MNNTTCNGYYINLEQAQAPTKENDDYITCQGQLAEAIFQYNSTYRDIQSKKPAGKTDMNIDVSNKLKLAYNNFIAFLDAHQQDNVNSIKNPPIQTIVDLRADLKKKVEMLNSMNGAPKLYNQPDNLYDDYRVNYNITVYVSSIVSLLAVILLYIYFSLL
jgi:hypothetical protein